MDFQQNLECEDEEIFSAIHDELHRQQNQIELIASENIVSPAVLEAQGSILTNKYAEGYPARRYYGGCEFVDKIETLAIERVKQLFSCQYANVQPHSGSQANTAVYMALLNPGDTILGMSLDAGGHLTHGARVSLSGKWFNSVAYGVKRESGLIDYEQVEVLARTHHPKLIIAGGSAYPRKIDFAAFRRIADETGAYFMVDMAHFAGLVAANLIPSPLQYADVVTSTTHKTLRGPRGGLILTNREDIIKKINSAVFPGIQGGPLEHIIAAKAVCFKEALSPQFKQYAAAVRENAVVLGETLKARGLNLVSGGTDTHLLLVDLRPKGLSGDVTERGLENAHITCNKNAIPFDPLPPKVTSGIRLGTPAGTTRGFREKEFMQIGNWIGDIVDVLSSKDNIDETTARIREEVISLCDRFPIYK
ncbi:MAG: serine hydroxymethyltransferase [Alphaproteobacteria bacterium]|nr:serine hydroxymethyltransferase [Alphaproteobacteria bacterium]